LYKKVKKKKLEIKKIRTKLEKIIYNKLRLKDKIKNKKFFYKKTNKKKRNQKNKY